MIIGLIMLVVVWTAVLLAVFNRHLPKWFCRYLGWHLQPRQERWDGCSFSGVCPRCGKFVLQDSQGNWF